ncbi:hypothetical protein MKW98_021589 [Papaver atlanticum]|uniref:RING-type E3 ubiquitin transferase n=1 Tax=Papaver atlanticum TaxID=357466 RepID=A0AAD4XTZ9_9MAGN|nr:hypothetical protein MKW98_021589 [Papaver atlanticum]
MVKCSDIGNEPEILYPFVIKDRQGGGCGYPGFNITCNTFDKTVLKLPQSGEFLVRSIDYDKKEIRLYDQNNCLPRRYQQQNLNVNLSPFKAFHYQTYNIFSCPPSIQSDPAANALRGILIVPCLSNSTTTVLVSVSDDSQLDGDITRVLINGGCQRVSPITIPIPFHAITKVYDYWLTVEDLFLTWVEPRKPKEEEKFNWKKTLFTIIIPVLGGLAAIATIVDLLRKRRKRKQKARDQMQNGGNL